MTSEITKHEEFKVAFSASDNSAVSQSNLTPKNPHPVLCRQHLLSACHRNDQAS